MNAYHYSGHKSLGTTTATHPTTQFHFHSPHLDVSFYGKVHQNGMNMPSLLLNDDQVTTHGPQTTLSTILGGVNA